MKTVKLTKQEINMLLHGYYAWLNNDGDTEDSGFSKQERKDMKSAYNILIDVLNA